MSASDIVVLFTTLKGCNNVNKRCQQIGSKSHHQLTLFVKLRRQWADSRIFTEV